MHRPPAERFNDDVIGQHVGAILGCRGAGLGPHGTSAGSLVLAMQGRLLGVLWGILGPVWRLSGLSGASRSRVGLFQYCYGFRPVPPIRGAPDDECDYDDDVCHGDDEDDGDVDDEKVDDDAGDGDGGLNDNNAASQWC